MWVCLYERLCCVWQQGNIGAIDLDFRKEFKATVVMKELTLDPNLAYGIGKRLSQITSTSFPQRVCDKGEDENGYTLIDDYIDLFEKQSHSMLTTDMSVKHSISGDIDDNGSNSSEANPAVVTSVTVHEDNKRDGVEIIVAEDNPAYGTISPIYDDSGYI